MMSHFHQILGAVKAGDPNSLRNLIQAGVDENAFLNFDMENFNQSTLLHYAVMSQNVEVVKLVTNTFNVDFRARDQRNLTPLMLACCTKCPIEIITHLMELMNDYEAPSPLDIAVCIQDFNLIKALIPYKAKFKAESLNNALCQVITKWGCLQTLQGYLDVPYCAGSFSVNKERYMNWFALCANYGVEEKVACFKILYDQLHPNPNPTVARRYNVNDVLIVALNSTSSTSLVPHFVETERNWEHRPMIRSLYKRLHPRYELLALMVFCECGPVTIERKQLDAMLEQNSNSGSFWLMARSMTLSNINELFERINSGSMGALQLLKDLAAFTKTMKLTFFRKSLQAGVLAEFLKLSNGRFEPSIQMLHRFKCLMIMYNDSADDIVLRLITNDRVRAKGILIFSLLRYCARLLMRPIMFDSDGNIMPKRFHCFVLLFGTWASVKCLSACSEEKWNPEVFPLKRLARDAVREAVLQGMKGTDADFLFFERLESLEMPKVLRAYLRYCDHSSVQCFLENRILYQKV